MTEKEIFTNKVPREVVAHCALCYTDTFKYKEINLGVMAILCSECVQNWDADVVPRKQT